jgi:uncharacterized BrkB/YihY/UPF0761 family membrane protein
MDSALHGLLIGLAIGAVLLIFEYMMINKAVKERAKKYNRKPEFDVTDKRRMHSMLRFAVLLPFGFAIGFWIISFAK